MRRTFPEPPWGIRKPPFLQIPSASLEGCEDQHLTWFAHQYTNLAMRNLAVRG